MARQKRNRSTELLAVASRHEQIAIITHDNPDPDAIAAGWAVRRLLRRKLRKDSRLIGGGDIVRAENRHMMTLLDPPLELVQQLRPRKATGAILIDCTPKVAAHLLSSPKVELIAVIDHHQSGRRPELPFVDIRPRMAASASMAADYLREQKVRPDQQLATALLYAIRTETCGNEFRHTRLDRTVINWLTSYANPEWMAEIENAPLNRSYFGDLVLALQNTFLYAGAAFCLLPRAQGQEIVGEVADLLIRCDGVERVFCGAAVTGDLLCSVRTQQESDRADQLVRDVLNGIGFGGGHRHRAGGKVADIPGRRISESFQEELRNRWISACGLKRRRGTRLIRHKDLITGLTRGKDSRTRPESLRQHRDESSGRREGS